jgi:hypothetical protein
LRTLTCLEVPRGFLARAESEDLTVEALRLLGDKLKPRLPQLEENLAAVRQDLRRPGESPRSKPAPQPASRRRASRRPGRQTQEPAGG